MLAEMVPEVNKHHENGLHNNVCYLYDLCVFAFQDSIEKTWLFSFISPRPMVEMAV